MKSIPFIMGGAAVIIGLYALYRFYRLVTSPPGTKFPGMHSELFDYPDDERHPDDVPHRPGMKWWEK